MEIACERLLFASPEAVAAAVEYVDARFSLLASSAALAGPDPGYQPMFERLRRGLEADRYGLVAHVLMTRGCNAADCVEIWLLRDPARVVANMQVRAFETSLGAHALAWQSNGSSPAVASAAPFAPQPPSAIGAMAPFAPQPPSAIGALAPAASGGPDRSTSGSANAASAKFDFPSANSIPAAKYSSTFRSQAGRRRQRSPSPARRRRNAPLRPLLAAKVRGGLQPHRLPRRLLQPPRPRFRSRRRLHRSRRPFRPGPTFTPPSERPGRDTLRTIGPVRC